MRIDSARSRREENSRIKSKTSDVRQKDSFSGILNEKITFDFSEAVDQLLNDLKEEERQFLQDQSLYQMYRYKGIVEKILKKITDGGYETVKLKRLRKDRADFMLIKKVNSKLYEISREITKNNKAFNLLKAIEEIRGLIMDILY